MPIQNAECKIQINPLYLVSSHLYMCNNHCMSIVYSFSFKLYDCAEVTYIELMDVFC